MQTRSSPSRNTLHRLAEQASIPDYKRLSKKVLYDQLRQQFNMERLQRAEKRTNKLKRSMGELDDYDVIEEIVEPTRPAKKPRASRKSKAENFDPIMRTPLGKNIFTFVRPNGSCVQFNVESLIDYLLESGDFTDPASRLPFSDEDLKMIDLIASKAKLKKKSVFDAKMNQCQIYREKQFRRDALLGLERCAGEIVSEMLRLVESSDPEEAQIRLLMTEFPSFADLFRQIKDVDSQYASQCNRSWLLYLQGPPNRPNRDATYGLLKIVQHFIKCCDTNSSSGLFPEFLAADDFVYRDEDDDDDGDGDEENEETEENGHEEEKNNSEN